LESVSSLPFLAKRRMIILSNPSANKSFVERIDQLLEAVADTTDLIIIERKFDRRLILYKTLKKFTDFREFNELDERSLANWLVREAKIQGGELNISDANYLVQLAGLNQLGLSHELDKLLSFDPHITRKAIEQLVEPLPQSSVFDLLDAAFAGNKQKTLALYQDQRKQQVEPQAIMGMLAWQVHVLAVVKFSEKDGPEAITKAAKLNPYVVRKTMNVTRNLTRDQVKELVSRALELDVRLKSETIDADDAVQHFLLTILKPL
ncbi:MAG: DNA polymerase III subunit delta, partial [bacterium]|nr:DNA polymerase III subunit delta [bacterium]